MSAREEGARSDVRRDDERAATTSRPSAEPIVDAVRSRGLDPRPLLSALNVPGIWISGDQGGSVQTQNRVAVLDSL